jgi:hypothetical protein
LCATRIASLQRPLPPTSQDAEALSVDVVSCDGKEIAPSTGDQQLIAKHFAQV